jgi:hypothetical protein
MPGSQRFPYEDLVWATPSYGLGDWIELYALFTPLCDLTTTPGLIGGRALPLASLHAGRRVTLLSMLHKIPVRVEIQRSAGRFDFSAAQAWIPGHAWSAILRNVEDIRGLVDKGAEWLNQTADKSAPARGLWRGVILSRALTTHQRASSVTARVWSPRRADALLAAARVLGAEGRIERSRYPRLVDVRIDTADGPVLLEQLGIGGRHTEDWAAAASAAVVRSQRA